MGARKFLCQLSLFRLSVQVNLQEDEVESWRVGKSGHTPLTAPGGFSGEKLKSTAALQHTTKGIWYMATPQLNQLLVQSPVPYPTEARPLRVGLHTARRPSPCEFRQRDGREGMNPRACLLFSHQLTDGRLCTIHCFSFCRVCKQAGSR